MPKTPEQYEKIREKSKQKIENAALENFANEGFHNTTMAKIAKKAGVSVGLAYNYYKSKDELLLKILLDGIARLTGDIDGKEIINKNDVKQFLENFFKDLKENVDFWKLYLLVLVHPKISADQMAKILKVTSAFQRAFYLYFKNSGSNTPETDTAFFYSLLDGVFMDYLMIPGQYPIDDIKRKIFTLYELQN